MRSRWERTGISLAGHALGPVLRRLHIHLSARPQGREAPRWGPPLLPHGLWDDRRSVGLLKQPRPSPLSHTLSTKKHRKRGPSYITDNKVRGQGGRDGKERSGSVCWGPGIKEVGE